MADYQLQQSGPTIQEAINIALGVQSQISQEATARENADALLATKTALAAETSRAQAAEALLATISSLNSEIARATGREDVLRGLIDAIAALIPTQATDANQLADKAFVNSSIATSAATFRGTSATGLTYSQFIAWANSLPHEVNDYVYWNTVDGNGNTIYKKYHYDGSEWLFEYDLNNSSFTASQWAAINSAITSELVQKLGALPTNTELQAALNAKQATLTFDDVPTAGSSNPVKSGGVKSAINALETFVANGCFGISFNEETGRLYVVTLQNNTTINDANLNQETGRLQLIFNI